MKYIIGVDCGGTKTEAVAYQLSGEELSRQITGFGNIIVDYNIGTTNIKEAIAPLLIEFGSDNCEMIVCGIAGIDSGGLKEKLAQEFSSYPMPVVLMNDGQLALYSLLKGRDGIGVTAGTGSVFLARVQSNWYRAGGWGHLLGDEGSAHWLAKEAIRIVLNEYDCGKSPSTFSQAILSFFETEDVLIMVKKVYQLPKGDLAQLASIVADLALQEEQASALLKRAGVELAKGVQRIYKQLPLDTVPLLIGLNGSVIERNQLVRQEFFTTLETWQQARELVFLEKEESCAKGAYYYYKKDGIK